MDSKLALDDVSRRRWDKTNDPAGHDPEVALAAAAECIRERGADHVIVLIARRVEGLSVEHQYLQAGTLDHLAQIGLLAATQGLMTRD